MFIILIALKKFFFFQNIEPKMEKKIYATFLFPFELGCKAAETACIKKFFFFQNIEPKMEKKIYATFLFPFELGCKAAETACNINQGLA